MSVISIAMATYNGARFLKEQLDSLRLQTRPADEVIICDDCSTDDTAALVRGYIEEYGLAEKGWSFSVNESNKGWIRNFLDTLAKTRGDIIFFSDQDDIWLSDKIEAMTAVMEAKEQVLLLKGERIIIGADGEELYPENRPLVYIQTIIEKIPMNKRWTFTLCAGCMIALRREVAVWMLDISERLYDSKAVLRAHDWQAASIAVLLDGAYEIKRPVIYYRIHGNNATAVLEKGKGMLSQRIVGIETDIVWAEAVLSYFSPLSNWQRQLIQKIIRFYHKRKRFLESGNPFLFLWLLCNYAYYPSFTILAGDFVYAYGLSRFAGKVYSRFRRFRQSQKKENRT